MKLRQATNRIIFPSFFGRRELDRLRLKRGQVVAIIIDSFKSSRCFNFFDSFNKKDFHLQYCSMDNRFYKKKNHRWITFDLFNYRPHHYNVCIIEKGAIAGEKFKVIKTFLQKNKAQVFQWDCKRCVPYEFAN